MQHPNEPTDLDTSTWPKPTHVWNWSKIVAHALAVCGGTAPLRAIYGTIAEHPHVDGCDHWEARVRATLQRDRAAFVRVADGV